MYDAKCDNSKFLLRVPPLIRWLFAWCSKNICRSHYNFSIVPVAVIRVAVGEICSMRIPKINDDKIMFEPTFNGIVESVTKSSFAVYTEIIERAWFLKFLACCGTILELGNS
jgi:hypothetical protein